MYWLIIVVGIIFSGCTAMKQKAGFGIDPQPISRNAQPFQSSAIKGDLDTVASLTTYVTPLRDSSWQEQERYCYDDGGVGMIDTWRALVMVGSKTYDISAVLTPFPSDTQLEMVKSGLLTLQEVEALRMNLVFVIPGKRNLDLQEACGMAVSAFGDRVIFPSGEIIPITKQELLRIQQDPTYRASFLAAHSSRFLPEKLESSLYGNSGDTAVFKEFRRYFSTKNHIAGEHFHTSKRGYEFTKEQTPQEEWLDKYVSRFTFFLSLGTFSAPEYLGARVAWDALQAYRVDPHKACIKSIRKNKQK